MTGFLYFLWRILVILVAYAIASYAAGVSLLLDFVGMPAATADESLQEVWLKVFLLAGVAAGGIIYEIEFGKGQSDDGQATAGFIIAGLIGGFVCWLVAGRTAGKWREMD